MNDKLEIVRNFIQSYNTIDINGMLQNLHYEITFENITNGQVNVRTKGIKEFTKQAEIAKAYFSEREAKIIDVKYTEDSIEVLIDYVGVLSKDLPDGPQSGDTIRLKGKSVYKFKDGKIISLKDIS